MQTLSLFWFNGLVSAVMEKLKYNISLQFQLINKSLFQIGRKFMIYIFLFYQFLIKFSGSDCVDISALF